MPTIAFFLPNDALPRTEYWQRLTDALRRNAAYRDSGAEVLIPAEDIGMETNWPRYGRRESAVIRGSIVDYKTGGLVEAYAYQVLRTAQASPSDAILYINMNPFLRISSVAKPLTNVVVADVSLSEQERTENVRTISMPASPIVTGAPRHGPRPVLASFQGASSHPVRGRLAAIADGKSIIVNLVRHDRHSRRVDAVAGRGDTEYAGLLARSTFAFVPRGDRHFSYRLLEVMSFGCVPVILSDGWVLPFDRTVPWDKVCVRVQERETWRMPALLAAFSDEEIAARKQAVTEAYSSAFGDFDKIAAGMLAEVDVLLHGDEGRRA